MSKPNQNNITCRQCGWQQDFTVWESLNVTMHPERKGELLRGELTRFTCSKCGWATEVVYPLLYHDMEAKLMFWLVPSGDKQNAENFPFRKMMRDYRFRFVSNRNELLEKILIFEAELDDRVLECLKLLVLSNSAKDTDPTQGPLFFAAMNDEPGQSRRIYFDYFTADGSKGVGVPFAAYDGILKELSKVLSPVEEERNQWLRVDAGYARQLMGGPVET
jgi:hypothetical protein